MFTLAAIGHTHRLLTEVSQDKSLLDYVDNWGHTVLYLATRCGFFDTTEALLKVGASVNRSQANGSTPLHGAAYYAQAETVKLLLIYAADPDAKKCFGFYLSQILANHKADVIVALAVLLYQKGWVYKFTCLNMRVK